MKKLFEQFEQQSTEAQALLEKSIRQMQDGIAPDPSQCREIASALSALRTTYDEIRRTIPEQILEGVLPEGELPVHEYEEAWKNSIICRKNAVRDVLDEFIRVYSDEKKYMDAIEAYIHDAKELFVRMDSAEMQVQLPDVSTFRLFLDGVKADLSSDEELYDRLLDNAAFTPRIVKGLYDKKYHIHNTEIVNETKADAQTEASPVETETLVVHFKADTPAAVPVATEAQNPVPENGAAIDDGLDVLTPEESVEKYVSDSDTPVENATSPAEDEPETLDAEDVAEEYLHPINPIKSSKLPSDQKLRELINRTGEVFRFLIDKLVFTGLMDERYVFDTFSQMKKPLTREQCIESFALLERKGLLCTYEFDNRNILCFTELMEACLNKAGLSSMLKRLYHLKNLGKIHFTAKQDMPVSKFVQQMVRVDQYLQAMDILGADGETASKLKSSTWNNEKHYFLINLSLDDSNMLPLRIVAMDDFASSTPNNSEGILCCADELPEMRGVTDQLHYCLMPKGLFQWAETQWIAVTHDKEADCEASKVAAQEATAQAASESQPSNTEDNNADTESLSASLEPIVPGKQTSPTTKPVEGLWLDDLSEETATAPEVTIDEFANLSSSEIAKRLLKAGSIPSDEKMVDLIHQLLTEGVRSHDVHNCHDQLVEAIVLAKTLASNSAFPMSRNIYFQLHAAIPFFRETGANTGVALSSIFADETKFTSVAKLCSYIYGMLFPAHAHDHTFSALYNNAFANYESQFPGLDVLKPLYHKAMEALKLVPTAFSPANLAAMSDSKIRQERMNSIRTRAKELLKPPTEKVMIHGVPELIDLCFGSKTDLHSTLKIVEENDVSMRELVKTELGKYCRDDEIDISTLEHILDSQWGVAAQKYSSRRMGIKYDARKHLLHAFEERLTLLQEWLDETDTEAEPDVEKLRAVRNEVLRIIDKSLNEINAAPYSATYGIMKASLELIQAKLQSLGTGMDFSTMLRSEVLVIDNGELILNDDLNEIEFAEPW